MVGSEATLFPSFLDGDAPRCYTRQAVGLFERTTLNNVATELKYHVAWTVPGLHLAQADKVYLL